MHRGIDPHRHAIGVFVGDPLVHLEQVAVAVRDAAGAQPLNRVAKIQIDAQTCWSDPSPFIADLFRRP
jgi:hypothetical protein